MIRILWLVPLLPFAGFAVNGLLGARVLPRRVVGFIACAAVLASFLISLGAVSGLGHLPESSAPGSGAGVTPGLVVDHEAHRVTQTLYEWMPLGPGKDGKAVSVAWSYVLDPLSAVMLLVVTGVGFLIHLYSIGYMEHEDRAGFARFFAYLNLFMGMMLVLVLGGSLPVLFVGWEGVGLCSYLLIGFWYDRMFDEKSGMSVADAGRKAFLVNRIGDTGFILGTLLLLSALGTLEIQGILKGVPGLSAGMATAAALLLFVGVCGKSAQIPLYVWLPDAMAGPTPVSALIHAATMVTAGVYVLARMAGLYVASPTAMTVVAVTGGLTALVAATLGVSQTDIKKVLAYSTVSQLGYMVLAAGVGAFGASVFHLMTHAFFKALLFLGAGSVIHALSGEQDIMKMGGLRGRLPWTHATFLIGTLAIAGVPPLAGFFSKDEILWSALAGHGGNLVLWLAGVITAGLTAFYMTRLYMLTFAGPSRLTHEAEHHLHESPMVMLLPLILLAIGSVFAGLVGVPHFLGGDAVPNLFERWLEPVMPAVTAVATHGAAGAGDAAAPLSEWVAMIVALLASAAGIAVGYTMYRNGPLPERPSLGVRLVRGKYFVDEAYDRFLVGPYRFLCRLGAALDARVVDGLVNAVGFVTDLTGEMLRLTQTGYVRNYALGFFGGTILILYYVLR
jgi:NADH-quinone oxidoreductase subunit L